MASSISPTSAKRASTAVAASSGTPRRRSVSASCALVRGAAVSSRRQISRATDSGSSASSGRSARASASPLRALAERRLPGTGPSRHHLERRPGRRVRRRRHVGIQPRPDPELLLDLLLDLVRYVRVRAQVIPGVLLALAELVAVVGVPGTGLADDRLLDAQVDQAALAADPDAVEDVEFGDFEWRRHLVLHDLGLGPVADRLVAVLQRLDPPYVDPHRRVELQRLAASRRLRTVVNHDAVDEVVVSALDLDVEPVHRPRRRLHVDVQDASRLRAQLSGRELGLDDELLLESRQELVL